MCWSHRHWVARRWLRGAAAAAELESLWPFVETHVSDHAALHHRQVVLEHCLEMDAAQLDAEVSRVSALVRQLPDHEALWYHLRWLDTVGRRGTAALARELGDSSW